MADTNAATAYAGFAGRYDDAADTKAHNALYERPAAHALLGDVAGLKVLDAGCGSGVGSALLARHGASVTGIDLTPEMLARAKTRCAGLDVTLHQADLTAPLSMLADAAFDAVLSSLAFDYILDLAPTLAEFARVTRPGGRLVFSMSHPMRDWSDPRTHGDGTYFDTTLWGLHWGGFGEPRPYVESFRCPLSAIFNPLAQTGWRLESLVEPLPLPEMETADPEHFAELSDAPAFLCVAAIRV